MYSGALAECVPATGTTGFPGAIGVCWSSREIETRRGSPPRVSRRIGFERRTGFSRSTSIKLDIPEILVQNALHRLVRIAAISFRYGFD
jgi:hypothetical protein